MNKEDQSNLKEIIAVALNDLRQHNIYKCEGRLVAILANLHEGKYDNDKHIYIRPYGTLGLSFVNIKLAISRRLNRTFGDNDDNI